MFLNLQPDGDWIILEGISSRWWTVLTSLTGSVSHVQAGCTLRTSRLCFPAENSCVAAHNVDDGDACCASGPLQRTSQGLKITCLPDRWLRLLLQFGAELRQD
ncbi:hypothetical protein AMECASPLE_024803 [Ameca splendens]|uniref:Uncharacterized protein n=1 Tax=Ameca splendens TaxID=208324 RepID=A0ABV0Z2F3_9TELE